MKICFVADGGSEHTQVFADYFAQNHEVHLISHRFRKNYDSRVHLHRLRTIFPKLGNASKYASFFLWTLDTKRLIGEIKPEIVNVHYVTTYGLLTSLVRFHPMVMTAWGSDVLLQPRRNPLWRHVVKSALARSDLLTCLFDSRMLNDNIGSLIPPGLEMASLLHGIDTGLFRRTGDSLKLRRSYGIDETDPVIITTRGLDPVYDPATFVRAMPIVLGAFPRCRFLVTYQKKSRRRYEDLMIALNVRKSVVILDWVPKEEVARHLAMADIYVSTALSDGASNALFEGMACELAPVVTDITANRYWIKNGENGLMFRPGDHEALAEAVIRLLRDKEKRMSFGEKCRKIVQRNAERRTQMALTEKIYQELTDGYHANKLRILE